MKTTLFLLRATFATLASLSLAAWAVGITAATMVDFFSPLNRFWSHVWAIGFCLFFVFGTAFAFVDEWYQRR